MFRRTVRTFQSRIVPVSGRCLRHTYIYMLSLTKARRLSVFSDGALKDSAGCGWMQHHGARGRIVAGRCPGDLVRAAACRWVRAECSGTVAEASGRTLRGRRGALRADRFSDRSLRGVAAACFKSFVGIVVRDSSGRAGAVPRLRFPAAEVCPLEACSADGGFRRLLFVVMGLRIFLLPRHEVCECRENLSPSARRPKRTTVPANF